MSPADANPSWRVEPETVQQQGQGVRLIETATPTIAGDIRDTSVIKEGDLFFVTDLQGNVPCDNPNGLGLYRGDTRHLSKYELVIEGLSPTILLSDVRAPFLASQVLTNPLLAASDGTRVGEQTLQIRRYQIVRGGELRESITFENLNVFPLTLAVSIHVDADFADMFEVRGIVLEEERPPPPPPRVMPASLHFTHLGRDGARRETVVRFEPAPKRMTEGTACLDLDLEGRGSARIEIVVTTGRVHARQKPRAPSDPFGQVSVTSSNSLFDAIWAQSRFDMRVLWTGADDETFVAAGLPWYAALFGRDSLITALEELWIAPQLAKCTLRLLARHQGRERHDERDEEPGKILHEMRRGELSRAGLVPFSPYYGTADATPLWIILLGEYYTATADLDLVRELAPSLDAALRWMDEHADLDGDGFIEYERRSSSGLSNQGWKDSWDAIVHADGSLVRSPTALVEVQAYAYAARVQAARLVGAMGDAERAQKLQEQAVALRDAFDAAFWMPEHDYYCLALDRDKAQAQVVSSNPGHALWCNVVPEHKVDRVAARLMTDDLFSGWGVRTLSTRERRYNPAGYHVGSVWPHDNALIALGLKRAHQEPLLLELVSGLYAATTTFPSYRTPELFCGFARSAFGVAVRYPVACNPQAWAAGAWSMLLSAILGLSADATAGELRVVRPTLPPWLSWVHVRGIPVGKGEVDLRFERVRDHTAVDVEAMRGGVRVANVDRWEP